MEKQLTLSDIVRQRKELTEESDQLRARLSDVSRRLHILDMAEDFVRQFGTDVGTPRAPKKEREVAEAANVTPKKMQIVYATSVRPRPPTIKDMIVALLRQLPNVWTDASEIQTRVSEMKGDLVPMSTVSPYLTELKNDQVIVRSGMKIALKERVTKEIEPSNANAEDGS